jgi:hypothetical protein
MTRCKSSGLGIQSLTPKRSHHRPHYGVPAVLVVLWGVGGKPLGSVTRMTDAVRTSCAVHDAYPRGRKASGQHYLGALISARARARTGSRIIGKIARGTHWVELPRQTEQLV